MDSSTTLVPRVVDLCCSFIETNGIFTEGIYRVPGNGARIKELRRHFDMDEAAMQLRPYVIHSMALMLLMLLCLAVSGSLTDCMLSHHSSTHRVPDIAGLLKLYFRTLPQPLFTHELYSGFLSAVRVADHTDKLWAVKEVLQKLPTANYETLKVRTSFPTSCLQHCDSLFSRVVVPGSKLRVALLMVL